MGDQACQTPLTDLLRIPVDACLNYDHSPTESQHIPVGRLCNEAAERIAELESALAKSASREAALVEKLKAAEDAVVAMAEDGWLDHGPEGMSEAQEKCYSAYLAKIKEQHE